MEAEDDDDDDSEDDVRYYHDNEYDRRHEISNSIVPNKSWKYEQGMKIDDQDYDGDNEEPNKSKQRQNKSNNSTKMYSHKFHLIDLSLDQRIGYEQSYYFC